MGLPRPRPRSSSSKPEQMRGQIGGRCRSVVSFSSHSPQQWIYTLRNSRKLMVKTIEITSSIFGYTCNPI